MVLVSTLSMPLAGPRGTDFWEVPLSTDLPNADAGHGSAKVRLTARAQSIVQLHLQVHLGQMNGEASGQTSKCHGPQGCHRIFVSISAHAPLVSFSSGSATGYPNVSRETSPCALRRAFHVKHLQLPGANCFT